MPRGHRQTLVEAILVANFRPDRQGPLLISELLPPELPVAGSEAARTAWGELVAAQGRYRQLGAPDCWGFSALVRRLHTELAGGEVSSEERFRVRVALTWGPWKITTAGGLPWGEPTHSDEALRAHWEQWAQHEEPSPGREWGEQDFAVQRFSRGLEPAEAFRTAHRRAEDVRARG